MIEEGEFQSRLYAERQAKMVREGKGGNREFGIELVLVPLIKTQTHMLNLMKYLSLLKQQLHNMPSHHLISTIFSPKHYSILLLYNGKLTAGLTFRSIPLKPAFELSLIAATPARKGYGSLLVNQLKSLGQCRGTMIIVTHADNNAIGFYQKMGFGCIQLMENRQVGQKHYTDSTIMQVRIDPYIDYHQIGAKIKLQRQFVCNELNKNQIEYSLERVRTINGGILTKRQYFCMDPQSLRVDDFWGEYRRLIDSKEVRIYRKYIVDIDKLIKDREREMSLNDSLEKWGFEDKSRIRVKKLKEIREKAWSGRYQFEGDMWRDIEKIQEMLLQNSL